MSDQRPSDDRIKEWVVGATNVLTDPLPAGHKLWKSWALDLADQVLALARLHADPVNQGRPRPDYDPHIDYPERFKEGPI